MTIVDHHDDAATTTTRPLSDFTFRTELPGPDHHETPATRTPGDHARRTVTIVAASLLLVLIAAAATFAATGGHWFVVRTPSMGTAAPVGTLVLTRPTTVADLQVGDVVAFHPTDARQLTYTHRIVAITGDAIQTRGDINGSTDPWKTTDTELVGKAVTIAPGVGYLARALPLLLVGGLLVIGLTRWWLRADRRGPVRMLGFSALYIVATVIIRPFVGLRQLATTNGPGGADVTAVSTGLLPIRIEPLAGHGTAAPVHLSYGEVGTIHMTGAPDDNRYALAAHLDLPWTGWLVLAAVWVLPVLWVFVVGFRRSPFPSFVVGLPDPHVTPVGALA